MKYSHLKNRAKVIKNFNTNKLNFKIMLQVVKMFHKETKKSKMMVELICDNTTGFYYVVGKWVYDDEEQVFQSDSTEYYDDALTTYIEKVLEYNQLKKYQQTHYLWK